MEGQLREKFVKGKALSEKETRKILDEYRGVIKEQNYWRRTYDRLEAKYGRALKAAEKYAKEKSQALNNILKDPYSTQEEVFLAVDESSKASYVHSHIQDLR